MVMLAAGAFLVLLFDEICNTFFSAGSFLDIFVSPAKNYITLGAATLNFNLIEHAFAFFQSLRYTNYPSLKLKWFFRFCSTYK